MPSDKTTNYQFDLINDSDSVKAGVKTKPNANWNALDSLLHDDFATKDYVDDAIDDLDGSLATVAKSGDYDDLENKPLVKHVEGTPLVLDLDDIIANNDEYEYSTPEHPAYLFTNEQAATILAWFKTLSFFDDATGQVAVSNADVETIVKINNVEYNAEVHLRDAFSIEVDIRIGSDPYTTNDDVSFLFTSPNGFLTASYGWIGIPVGTTGVLTVYSDDGITSYYTSSNDLKIWDDIVDKPEFVTTSEAVAIINAIIDDRS